MLKIETRKIPDAPIIINARAELRPYGINEYNLFYQTIDTQVISGVVCMSPDSYYNETDNFEISIPDTVKIEVGVFRREGVVWDLVTVASLPADRMRVQAFGHGFKISVNSETVLETQYDSGEPWWVTITTSAWVTYQNLIPYTVHLKLDESLDEAIVQRLTTTEDTLPPLTKVRLVDGDIVRDFIVRNAPTERIGMGTYQQTLELIEPTEMLKGIPLENLTVTQPMKPDQHHPVIMLDAVIDRLLEVTPTTYQGSKVKALNTKYEFDPDIRMRFSKIKSPNFDFGEYTLFDALVDIGLYVDRFPRVRFGNYDANGKLTITFDELDPEVKNNYVATNLTAIETQQPLENYANRVVSEVSNMTSTTAVTYPGKGLGVFGNAPEGETEITDDNIIITLPQKIHKILGLKCFVLGGILSDVEEIDFTHSTFEYSQWVTLDGEAKKKSIYYKQNTNEIKNVGGYFKVWWHTLPEASRRAIYTIKYIPYLDTKAEKRNTASVDHTVIYNQTNKLVDDNLINRHLQNYINRMESGDKIISKLYKTLDYIPRLGHKINSEYILTNLSYIKNYDTYDVTMQLSRGYTRRAEYIKANNEIRTWEIPMENQTRRIAINEKMYVGAHKAEIETTAKENRFHLNRNFTLDFLYFLTALRPGYPTTQARDIIMGARFRLLDGSIIPAAIPVTTRMSGNSIGYTAVTVDNTIMGFTKSKDSLGYISQQVGATYTDAYGDVETIDVGFTNDLSSFDLETFTKNLPVCTVNQANFLINGALLKCLGLNVKKDARERLEISYNLQLDTCLGVQINYESVDRFNEFVSQHLTGTYTAFLVFLDFVYDNITDPLSDEFIDNHPGVLSIQLAIEYSLNQTMDYSEMEFKLQNSVPNYTGVKTILIITRNSADDTWLIIMRIANIDNNILANIGEKKLKIYLK